MHTYFEDSRPKMIDTANKITYAASGFTAFWGFVSENWIGIGGLVVAVVGLAIRTYLDLRQEARRMAEEERAQELHTATMSQFNTED